MSVHVYVPMCTPLGVGMDIRERQQVSCSITLCFISSRQGLLLNLELVWQSAGLSDPWI